MATMRELKRRIVSVQSSQKITGAMKMIASARLRKEEITWKQTRPYEQQLQSTLSHIDIRDCDQLPPCTVARAVRHATIVVLASDEGLCGSFNGSLLRKLHETVRNYDTTPVSVYSLGKKIWGEVRRVPRIDLQMPPAEWNEKHYREAIDILANRLIANFLQGKTDKVEIIYTHFKSIGTQEVVRFQLLPMPALQPLAAQAGKKYVYLYEPNAAVLLSTIYPMLIRAMFYKTFLESKLSEQANRIMAMQIANDNALHLLDTLKLEYNKLRQQSITTELLDIVGGTVQNEE